MNWIISVNSKIYDHNRSFHDNTFIDWVQSAKYNVGDIAYIYCAKPYSKIMYKCMIIKTNMSYDECLDDYKYWIDKSKYSKSQNGLYSRVKLIDTIDTDLLTLDKLKEHGLKGAPQGPVRVIAELNDYIESCFNSKEVYYEDIDEDNKLNDYINKRESSIPESFEYDNELVLRPKGLTTNKSVVYKRDHQKAINALVHAEFKCEVDSNHKTFNRRSDNKPYLEAHHLIPMSQQDKFDYSLDVEENIVSLCSHCHNEIHYGKDADVLITKLYNDRKELLKSKKIDVSLNDLLSFYGFIK